MLRELVDVEPFVYGTDLMPHLLREVEKVGQACPLSREENVAVADQLAHIQLLLLGLRQVEGLGDRLSKFLEDILMT